MSFIDSNEDLIDMLEDKVRHGWIFLFGDRGLITEIENRAYTPGTPANGDFGALMYISHCGPGTLFIAKKTPKLREVLSSAQDKISQREWDMLLTVTLAVLEESPSVTRALVELHFRRDFTEVTHMIESFAREMFA